ncbi:uncharacterized protein KY384_003715 [Bacidia gigantensis]|uniref:uncharacterized protein n=1 Tax=Bacidia gigantensis TaxID=2732470 RepID=UPI001D0440F3|nr:uncharacterized protein KY384_003715 [Bacidia gigantensis]KAG8532078.1 hypothetical protein KY384_003715 [Bacidia gigantensis]
MAGSTTDYSEIQRDEIEALRSIYPNDFVEGETKVGAWKKYSDPSFRISLRPSLNDRENFAITLIVSLPSTYPKTLPRLSLKYEDNVNQPTRNAAEKVLKDIPKTLVGSEMMYDITTGLQDILDKCAQVDTAQIPTLDEERNAKQENAKIRHAELEAERQSKALEVANKEAVDQESQLLHELAQQRKAKEERRTTSHRDVSKALIELDDVIDGLAFERPSAKVIDPSGKTLTLTAIFQKTQYRHRFTNRLFLVRPNQALESPASDPFLCLKECKCAGNDPSFKRMLQELELRLEAQMHRTSHPNVVTTLNFRIQRIENENSNQWLISILTEFTSRGSLYDLLDVVEGLDPKKTKAWSIQLLEGLHHFHQQGSAHGAAHTSNILLWKSEALTTVVKWSDGTYARSLRRLASHPQLDIPTSWRAPEDLASGSDHEVAGSTDVWYFGLCLMQMAFGSDVLRQYETPTVALNDLELTQSLKSVLQGIFHPTIKKRPSCWDLLHFEFFRNDDPFLVEEASTYLVTRPRTRRESEPPAEASEYARKFVEEGRLGRGGFGEVFRARNRIDGQLYAVKKIKAKSRAALDPVISETTVLSRLNNPHVVRYFSSWIEEDALIKALNSSDINTSRETDTGSLSSFDFRSILPPSSRGLDFISSNQVRFGNAEESDGDYESDESGTESSDNPSDPAPRDEQHADQLSNLSSTGDSNHEVGSNKEQAHSAWTILYIQMEYCNQETLRNLINSGIQTDNDESWRLFRQIVQGLAHIHAASIVHRDLKPENIFVDSHGDLRIGDFGLARPGEQYTAGLARTSKAITNFTKDIGTAWYVAPEVRSSSASKYDEKADLYSLGIILLEINVAFNTGMERAESLEPLAKEDHKLPQALAGPEKITQARLLMRLIAFAPSQRPSCVELLSEIPVQGEDQTSQLLRREVRDPNSKLRTELVAGLFAGIPKAEVQVRETQLALDMGHRVKLLDGTSAMSQSLPDLELQMKVKDRLMAIFRCHGAVERTDSPAMFPQHPYYTASDVVRILDPAGKMLQLPYDLVLPNTILIARSPRKDSKTFAFGDVYRPDLRKVDPNIYSEADFDVIGSDATNLIMDEAETIKVVDEIVDEFPNLSNSIMCYHINHSRILEEILSFCDIHCSKWFQVKETLSKLNVGDWTWQRIKYELRTPPLSIAATSLDELERFDFRDSVEKAISSLRSMLPKTADLEASLVHMQTLVSYLSRMKVRRKVYLSPLSSYNEKFYRSNLLFQCLFDRKRRAVFAAGGRYDRLIRDHQTLSSRESYVHGVGFQMTWSGLCAGMASYLNTQQKSKAKRKPPIDIASWITRRCDVLIDCYDPDLLENVGVRILSELWGHQIKAELASVQDATITNAAFTKASPLKEDPNWIVLIKFPDVVKVRNSFRQEDTEVRTVDLINYLRSEIRERDRNESRHPPNLYRNVSQQERPANDQEPNVKVLLSQAKGKKTNRKIIVEEALAQAQEWRKSLVEHPIIAVEIKEEIFQGIQQARLDDPDAWKKLIQTAPAGDRQYLGQVQTMLREQQSTTAAFLYNFRTKAILYYPIRKD